MNLYFIVFLLLPSVTYGHSEDIHDELENLIDTDDLLKAYIPVYPLNPNLSLKTAPPFKIKMTKTVFNFAFNAAMCNKGKGKMTPVNHTVIVSFLEDWSTEKRIEKADMMKYAVRISRKVKLEREWLRTPSFTSSQIWTREFPYEMTIFRNGSIQKLRNSFYRFSMYNADVQIELDKDSASIRKRRHPSENYAYENFIDLTGKNIRYVAIFANYMDRCETFVSAANGTFPFWIRPQGLPEGVGVPPVPRGDPRAEEVLLWVQGAAFVVVVFTLTLVQVVLPMYMEYKDIGGSNKVDILNLNYDNDQEELEKPRMVSVRDVPLPVDVSQKASTQKTPVKTPTLPTTAQTSGTTEVQPEKTQEMSESVTSKKKKKKKESKEERTQDDSKKGGGIH